MAYEEGLRSISLKVDSSLASATGPAGAKGHQYKFVKVVSTGTVGVVSANTDATVGVLQNKPQVTGAAATVGIRGVSLVEVGAANSGVISAGAFVAADASGYAVSDPGSGAIKLGIALASSTAAGQLIPVLLRAN